MSHHERPNTSRRDLLIGTSVVAGALTLEAGSGLSGSAFAQPADGASGAPIPKLPEGNPFATGGVAPKTSVPIQTTRKLVLETVTAESFQPFGWMLGPEGRTRLPINTYGDKLDLYREGFASDQPIEWFIVIGRPRWNGVLFLERHQQLTQTFIPVAGDGFYTVVARPGAREDGGFPALDELKAFYVPAGSAIQIHRATWHENPMPAREDFCLLVTSHANITLAHQQNADPALKDLPLDLERRWYRAGGFELTPDVA